MFEHFIWPIAESADVVGILQYLLCRLLLLCMQAQRLAAAEALIKNAHGGSTALGSSGGSADVEGRLKKLAAEVRLLKDRMGDLKPAATAAAAQVLHSTVTATCRSRYHFPQSQNASGVVIWKI